MPQETRCSWHMGHYGAPTPKPHYGYSNSAAISKLYAGTAAGFKRKREEEGLPKIETCTQCIDKDGKARYKGTRQLKKTESLNCKYSISEILSDPFCYDLWILMCLILYYIIWYRLEFSCPIALDRHLREYPVPFGRKFVDLYGELTSTAKGFSTPPEPLPPAMESFERTPFEDPGFGLEFAALEEVYTYLWKSK